jgi:hypothetical protein
MSEENKASRYMEVLDQWTKSTIIEPLEAAFESEIDDGTVVAICKAIRAKQLESYRNGLKAGGQPYPSKGGERRPAYASRFRNRAMGVY